MKKRDIYLSLTVVLILPMLGQHKHNDTTKFDMKNQNMAKMMGSPTV